jgi:hypothetical protein
MIVYLILPNRQVCWVMLETCISAAGSSNLGWTLAAPIEVVCGCRQSLPEN